MSIELPTFTGYYDRIKKPVYHNDNIFVTDNYGSYKSKIEWHKKLRDYVYLSFDNVTYKTIYGASFVKII